jgi:hypothetical protein
MVLLLMTTTVVSGGAAAWLWDESRQMSWLSVAIAVANYIVLTVYL